MMEMDYNRLEEESMSVKEAPKPRGGDKEELST